MFRVWLRAGFEVEDLVSWALEYHALMLFLLKGTLYEIQVYTFFSLVT